MRPIRDRSSTITWQECCPTSKPKSSGAPIRPKDSSYCPGAGSLNAPSPGSTAVEDLPRTGRTSIARASHSCALPQSASCCENSVIPLDVLGQTLTERAMLQNLGYLPNIRFNTVIDAALARQGLSRPDVYVTQTFHLIPRTRSERISQAAIRRSFDEVTRFELQGRKVIALGLQANASGITSSILQSVIPAGADTPTRKMRAKSPTR